MGALLGCVILGGRTLVGPMGRGVPREEPREEPAVHFAGRQPAGRVRRVDLGNLRRLARLLASSRAVPDGHRGHRRPGQRALSLSTVGGRQTGEKGEGRIAVKVSGIPSQLRPLSGAAVSYPSTRCPLDKVGPCCFGGGMTHRLQAQLSHERIASNLVPVTRAQRERRAVRSR